MRLDTSTRKSGMTSFALIGCESSEKYRIYKKDLVGTITSTRKCGCSFKLRTKPILGGEVLMVNLICETHYHALTKSFTGHPYVGRLTEDDKIIIGDMTKSMIKPNSYLSCVPSFMLSFGKRPTTLTTTSIINIGSM